MNFKLYLIDYKKNISNIESFQKSSLIESNIRHRKALWKWEKSTNLKTYKKILFINAV
jgi:hypothetical protein